MDVLSDLLRTIRLDGALFLNGEFYEPWCINAPRGGDLAHKLLSGARSLGICHLVLEGRCWARMQDEVPVLLQAGDAVLFPRGDPHLLGSALHHAHVSIDHVVQVRMPELDRVRYGGDGSRSLIVCGWFAYEPGLFNPLISSLPALFHVPLMRRPAGVWVEQLIRHALSEATQGRPGSDVVVAKVAEVVFVEALRAYIESLEPSRIGWLSGLQDPQIGRCLTLIHTEPARDWTVAELAQAVNMSRSVMAERFTDLMGMAPMQYVKRWRLARAAQRLRSEPTGLARIAADIGYASEAAFSRAFKAEYGVPPGLWRQAQL
jgi:AraC-like DNA-binding protein